MGFMELGLQRFFAVLQHLRFGGCLRRRGGGGAGGAGTDRRLNGNAQRERRQRVRLAGRQLVNCVELRRTVDLG